MKINHIASGSSGNAVTISDGQTMLMLDAGIRYQNLAVARLINLTDIEAVFVTHSHNDHCVAVPEMIRRGMTVYMSEGCRKEIVPSKICPTLGHMDTTAEGTFKVMAFDVIHDTPEPLGFMFQSYYSDEKGIYIADSKCPNYVIDGLTHLIVECNFQQNRLENNDKLDESVKERIRRNHMSLESLVEWLSSMNLMSAKEIHLIHMSTSHCHPKEAVDTIQQATGIPTYTLQQ